MIKIYYHFVLFISFIIGIAGCNTSSHITKVDTTVIQIDSISVIKEDTTSLRLIKPYKEKMDKMINEVLAYTDEVFVKNVPEGLLNNFVSDLLLKKANEYYKAEDGKAIDFCLLNNGGLRSSLPKGAITRGKIYELMPFENNLVVITLSGEKTKEIFNYIAKAGGIPIAGFSMGIKDTLPIDILVKEKPFEINRNYKVVTSDYLANGGDKMKFFSNPVKYENMGIKLRDAIIAYIIEENKNGRTLKSKLDKRIHYE